MPLSASERSLLVLHKDRYAAQPTLTQRFSDTERYRRYARTVRYLVVTPAGAIMLGLLGRAEAESPWVLQAGAGVGIHRTHADYSDAPPPSFSIGPGLQIDAGYRVHRIAAVGLHLGTQVIEAPRHLAINSFEDQTYVGIEAGLSGSVVIDRVTLSPWFGLQSLHNKRYRAAGLIGTYDVRIFDHERIAVFASVIVNNDLLPGDQWPISDVGTLVGAGYRYW